MQSGQAWTVKVPLHDDAGAVYSLEYNAVPVFSKVSSQENITIFRTQGYPNRKGYDAVCTRTKQTTFTLWVEKIPD